MNRANIIAATVIVGLFGSYFGYLGYQKSQERENVFSKASQVKHESLAIETQASQTFTYAGKAFSFKSLPEELRKNIRREQLLSHIKIQSMIKDFVVRYHVFGKNNQEGEIDVEKVPNLSQYIKKKVPESEVLALYNNNIKVFGENHDKKHIMRQIEVELLTKKAYEFITVFLTEIYYGKGLELASAPPLAREWLNFPIAKAFSSEPAPYELTWIGNYGCERCELHNADLGILIEKWGNRKIKLNFIPWSFKDLDALQALNLNALCIDKLKGLNYFWKFHALAMSNSSKLKNLKEDNYPAIQKFTSGILTQIGLNKDKAFVKEFNKCSNEYTVSKNPLLKDLINARSKLKIFNLDETSNFFLNGRLLDLEGRRLQLAVDSFIKERESEL